MAHLNLDLIQDRKALQFLTEEISKEKVLAIDTEFIREKTFFPILALIQIASKQEAWLVDPLAFSKEEIQPLLDVLTDKNIIKLFHSSFGDQECLYASYQMTASPTLDTFEAASLLGYGDSVSLRDLLQKSLGVKIPKFLARTNWLQRPLSEQLRHYAITDVQYLVEAYEKIIIQLEKLKRKDWALWLSAAYENHKLYADTSEEIAKRLVKSGKVPNQKYSILCDMVAWREERARYLNIPRKRVADDETLLNLVQASPTTLGHLSEFRGLNSGEVRKQGDRILKILSGKVDRSKKIPPIPKPSQRANSEQARVIDFLFTFLRARCLELKIAPRLVLTTKNLAKIVVEKLDHPEQWIEAGLCSPEACELIGPDLLSALHGKEGLAIKDGRLTSIHLNR